MKAVSAIDDFLRELQAESQSTTVVGELDTLQIALMRALLRNAWSTLATRQIHHIKIAVLANELNISSEPIETMKSALKALLYITVETELDGMGYRFNKLLASVEMGDGIIHYSFPPILRANLYH